MIDNESLDALFAVVAEKSLPQRNPFKFLDAYDVNDRAIFFGRDEEIRDLYARFYRSRILLVYGESGTGKTSLIECGLRSEIPSEEALFVSIRLVQDPVTAVRVALQRLIDLDAPETLNELIGSVIAAKSKMLVLVFDQFEEFFLLQSKDIRALFYAELKQCLATHAQLRLIIALRQEYLAHINELHQHLSTYHFAELWLRRLSTTQAHEAIIQPCAVCGVGLEDGLVERLLADLSLGGDNVELPLLQVVLDGLYQTALNAAITPLKLSLKSYDDLGQARNILANFLQTRLAALGGQQQSARQILKTLITSEGTRRPSTETEIQHRLASLDSSLIEAELKALLARLVEDRILREDADSHLYELRHDALALPIRAWLSGLEQELMDWRQILEQRLGEYQRQKRLLDSDFLASLAPYEARLGLKGDLADLLAQSKTQAEQKQRDKQRLRVGLTAGFVAVLFGFSAFSLMQWQAAKHEKQHAEDTEKRRSAELFQSLLTHASLLAKGEDYSGAKQKLNETDALDKDAGPAMRHARNLLRSFTDIMGGEADAAFDGKGADYPLITTAISPDGQLLAAGGEHGTLVIFDAATGKLLQHLEGHSTEGTVQDNSVRSIAFTPKGDTLISAGDDKKIMLWQRQGQSFYRQQVFAAPDKVRAIAISPDGQLLASGGDDNAVSLWSLPGGKLLKTLKQHTQTISDLGLAFSADGRYLASGSYDDTAILWEVASGKALHTLSGHNGNIHQVAFSADGQTLATASMDKTVRLWDVADGQLQRSLIGHSNSVFAVQFIGNGDTLLSAGFDRTLRLWDTKSGVSLRVLQGHEAGVGQAAVYGDRMFSASNDGSVRRWGLGLPYQQRVVLPSAAISNAVTPDLKNVAVGFKNGTLALYDVNNASVLWRKESAHDNQVLRLAFNHKGDLLASSSHDNSAKIWKVASPTSLEELQKIEEHKDSVHAVSFSPDSQTLATAGYDGKIGLFKLGSQEKPRFIENAHEGKVASVTFSQDGKQLLSSGIADFSTKLWNVQANPVTGQVLFKNNDRVMWSSWSPDNQSIAAVGRGSSKTNVYHTASRRLQYHLNGHEDAVYKAIFSPDSQQLATAGDVTAKFWELGQGKELFSVRLPVESAKPVPFWDFDFRCQASNCVMAVPLVRGLLQLYQFSYEAKPQFDANAEKRALIPLWQSYLDTVQIHLNQNALQPAAQALREADSIGKPLSAHYANDELILTAQLRSHYLNIELLNKQQQTDKALEAYPQAINSVEQFIKQHPDKPDYAGELILISKQYAQLAQSEQKTALVAEIYQRLFALPLENVPALVERAEYASQLGKQELVEKDLQTALEKVNKQNAEELNSVGYSLTNLSNRYQEAQQLLEQALVLSPNKPYILDSLGWTLFKMGQHQAALDYIQKSLAQKDKLSSNAFAEAMAHLDEIVKSMDKTKSIEISHQVVVGKVPDGSRAEKMGIKAGDIFVRYNNILIFNSDFFITYRDQETETTPARELEVLRDGKKLMFKLTAGKIGAELKTVENSAGNAVN